MAVTLLGSLFFMGLCGDYSWNGIYRWPVGVSGKAGEVLEYLFAKLADPFRDTFCFANGCGCNFSRNCDQYHPCDPGSLVPAAALSIGSSKCAAAHNADSGLPSSLSEAHKLTGKVHFNFRGKLGCGPILVT